MRAASPRADLIRLYALDLPPADLARLQRTAAQADPTLSAALGAPYDPAFAQIVILADFVAITLEDYLREGLGLDQHTVARALPALETMPEEGLLVLFHRALRKAPMAPPKSPLRAITEVAEDRPPVQFEPLPAESAKGLTGQAKATPPGPDKGWIGRFIVALILLLVAAICFIAKAFQ